MNRASSILFPIPNLLSVCSRPSFAAHVTPSDVSYKVPIRSLAFADGWEIESLEPVRLEIRPEYRQQGAFFGEDPRGWFLIARRLA
jgi:hypothetical protein